MADGSALGVSGWAKKGFGASVSKPEADVNGAVGTGMSETTTGATA